ncbi:hypothetical protein [Thiolapillus sp.]
MNYSSYLMRDQAHGVISSLDQAVYRHKRRSSVRRLRTLIEIGAFVAAVVSYLAALSLMT